MSGTKAKAAAMQAAFDAIAEANQYELSELEKSYLCDHVFQTARCDASKDGTVLPEHQYPKPRIVLQ